MLLLVCDDLLRREESVVRASSAIRPLGDPLPQNSQARSLSRRACADHGRLIRVAPNVLWPDAVWILTP